MHAALMSAWVEGMRRRSPEALAELYAEDATLQDPEARLLVHAEGDALKGREAIVAYWREVFKKEPHARGPGILKMVSQRHHAVLETVDAKRRYCHVFEVHDGKIVSHHVYWGWLPSPFVLDKLLGLE